MTVKTEKYVQIGTTTENQLSAGRGWSPILANVVDSERVVQQVIDWAGGSGAKPITGQYIGANGFVQDIADATDIKGAQGQQGDPESLQNIDSRIVVQLDTGGTIKSALDTKEPTITAGATSQYYRGDKTFQTLDKTAVGLSNVANVDTTTTANISDSADKRFVTDDQQAKFVAATTSADGYLTSADWNTFNNKQAALGYTAENSANKSDDITLANDSSTKYTTEHAVRGYIAATSATIANQRYSFNLQSGTTYTIATSDVTASGHIIVELSDGSFTNCTVPTPTSLGVTAGDSVNVSITGAYAAQKLLAGSGATLVGNALFSFQHETKTLIAKDSTTWKVVGG